MHLNYTPYYFVCQRNYWNFAANLNLVMVCSLRDSCVLTVNCEKDALVLLVIAIVYLISQPGIWQTIVEGMTVVIIHCWMIFRATFQ